MSQIDRKTFLKRAGLGSVAAASLPGLLRAPSALAGAANGLRTYAFVAFSQAPASGSIAQPRIGMQGEGVFKPDAHSVKGGGTFVFFDAAVATPRPLIAAGAWTPRKFVSYDTFDLPAYGNIQPAILEMLADFEGIGDGLTFRLICNVGAAGAAGMTGQPEGWRLFDTPFGTFLPLSPALGLTHLSIEGVTIDRGA